MKALWTHSAAEPWEYVELLLCRDVYHCTPSELAEQDWETVRVHLRLLSVEGKVQQAVSHQAPKGRAPAAPAKTGRRRKR